MHYITISAFLFCWTILLPGLVSLRAQERTLITRIETTPVVDGMPDEAFWETIDPFPLVTHLPVSGKVPGETSVIRLAYEDAFLYVGAKLLVSDPSLIRAVGKKRDLESGTCDWFGISLDTYNDKENALLFFTNPNGLRWDATVMNDGTLVGEILPMNLNWNTYWDVASRVDSLGWYTEMRIPLSSLRFQQAADKTVMGISIFRYLPALNEAYIYPETPLSWGSFSYLKPSRFAEIEFNGLQSRKPLYISPYLLTGYEWVHELSTDGTSYSPSERPYLEPGLDIKYGINPNTTLDVTVNTDFAQVEADDQQFNLTRFSLFYPEKRQFFLERNSIFDFELGGNSNLFYSRRIGLYEDSPVRILGGARINARVNDWDIGMLDLQTASFKDVLPSENFGVLRLKKRVLNENSYAGGIFTSRVGLDGSYNMAYGVDGVIRLFGDEYLTVRWAQVFQDSMDHNLLSADPSKLFVYWERRKQEGFSYLLAAAWSGKDFDPGIGFEIFEDYWVTRQDLIYTWISSDDAKLQSHNIKWMNYHINSVIDHSLLIWYSGPVWTFITKNNWTGSFSIAYNFEFLEEDFDILEMASVTAGSYRYVNAKTMLTTSMTRPLSAIIMIDGGQYYDGLSISPSIQPLWNIGSSLELGGIYRYDLARFISRDQLLNNHIAGLRALYMFNTKLSVSAFLQYNSAIHKVISNFRFRYNPREGTDLYVVFNEDRNTLLQREMPHLPPYDPRNFTLKFTHTFQLQR